MLCKEIRRPRATCYVVILAVTDTRKRDCTRPRATVAPHIIFQFVNSCSCSIFFMPGILKCLDNVLKRLPHALLKSYSYKEATSTSSHALTNPHRFPTAFAGPYSPSQSLHASLGRVALAAGSFPCKTSQHYPPYLVHHKTRHGA